MRAAYQIVLLLFFKLYYYGVAGAWTYNAERLIRRQLFDLFYDRLTRPSERTVINVGLNLLTINYLNIKTQELSCTGWLTVEWEDSRLMWNMTSGMESKSVYALNTEVWFPELFIDNSLSDVTVISNNDLLYKVTNKGRVYWEIPRIFTTHCEVDTTYFPFDTQSCIIELTSWVYSTEELILKHLWTDINTDEMVRHGEWIFRKSSVKSKTLTEVQTDGSNVSHSQLDFILVLERRPIYYITSIILPVILTSFLSVFVFILPVLSGEKASYSLTVLLAMAVLLTLIQDQMPSTALNVSYLSLYLSTSLGLNVISVFLTICVVNIYHHDPRYKPSKCLQALIRCLAKLVCFDRKSNEILIKRTYPQKRKTHRKNTSLWNGSIKLRANTADNRSYTRYFVNSYSRINYPYTRHDRSYADIQHIHPPQSPEVTESGESIISDRQKHTYTWKEIAQIIDFFLFLVMALIYSIVLTIFMILLTVGIGNDN